MKCYEYGPILRIRNAQLIEFTFRAQKLLSFLIYKCKNVCRIGTIEVQRSRGGNSIFLRSNLAFDDLGQCYKTFYGRNLQIFHNKLECLSLESFSCLA